MTTINQLVNDFTEAYQHSLYAIEKQEMIEAAKRSAARDAIKHKYERARSMVATQSSNSVMAGMHKINDAYRELTKTEDSIIRAAEYLAYGSVIPKNISRLVFANSELPWVMPLLGHKNLVLESNSDDSQALGLQIALQALMQTAPGQLSVTVVNPELRSEFSAFSRFPDYKMLTTMAEFQSELTALTEEILSNDTLLKGKYDSLVNLREAARQPVGRLRLLVIQDMPQNNGEELISSLLRVMRSAPRCGIAVIYLYSKNSSNQGKAVDRIRSLNNTLSFVQSGKTWKCSNAPFDTLDFVFPFLSGSEINDSLNKLIEAGKNTSAVTVPFNQIENPEHIWTESSARNLTFSLGKSGMDTVSVCLGDRVTQQHNILISGAAGKGKSNLLEIMIHSLCLRYSPSELELYLLDFKDGLTFKPYSAKDGSCLPHARMLGLESDRDIGLAILKDLEAERTRRANLFSASAAGVHDYESYRKMNPGAVLPRIVLIVDEYQKIFDQSDDISEEAAALLENIVRQGRACAIHIILASQSVTGTVGLLGKDERIYAQFPIRIALQNTLSESYSIFGIGNGAAADLRVRGEAIINTNYGAADSNQRFTVAYADPEEMKKLRETFNRKVSAKTLPIVFAKKDTANFSSFIPLLKTCRQASFTGGVIRLPLGILLSVRKDIISVSFGNEVGKNIAILGAGEDLQKEGVLPGQFNNAIGMLQSFAVSLALQHPNGNARFVMLDGLAADIRKNSNTARWMTLMERFGFPIEAVTAEEVSNWLIDFNREVRDCGCEDDTYLLGFGMDRLTSLSDMNLCGESGADSFRELLKTGSRGVHFLGWWSNITMFNNHMGFGNDGYIGTKVLLRTDTAAAREIMGPFVNWSIRDNRAYIHDANDLPDDIVVMPLIPLTDRECGLTEAEAW